MRFDTKEKYSVDPVTHRNGHADTWGRRTLAVNGAATMGTQTVRNDVEEERLMCMNTK